MTKSSDESKNQVKKQAYRLYAQFVLVGAALGAYYGIFYKNPERAVDFGPVIILSLLSAVVVTVIQIWKKATQLKRTGDLPQILRNVFLFTAMLEARPILKHGGKGLVVALLR